MFICRISRIAGCIYRPSRRQTLVLAWHVNEALNSSKLLTIRPPASSFHVTKTFVISLLYFIEGGSEMFKVLKHSGRAIVLFIKSFVSPLLTFPLPSWFALSPYS